MEIPLPLAPLVVGVTGHRDLRPYDVGRLRALVGRELDKLVADSPDTPLMLLSPLAEGADRLVAREALERDARLVVSLPLEQESYEEDFETEESLVEFRELLGKAETVVTLPHVSSTDKIKEKGPARNLQHTLAGACVARYSHILLALWDGEAGDDGVVQIVQFKRSGRFEKNDLQQAFERLEEPFGAGADLLAAPEPGLTLHVVTPHEDYPQPEKLFQVIELLPENTVGRQFFKDVAATNKRREAFNHDLKRLWRVTAEVRQKIRGYVFPEHTPQLPQTLNSLLDQQMGADVLATFFRLRTRRAVIARSILLFLAVTAYTFHSALTFQSANNFPWPLVLYLLLLAAAAAVHVFAKRFCRKSVDYLAVAEGLRVQFYWSLAGLNKSAGDHYPRGYPGELVWVPHILRPWAMPLLAARNWIPEESAQLVRKLWIEGQAQYFRYVVAQKNRKSRPALLALRNILLLVNFSIVLFDVLSAPQIFPEIRTMAKQAPRLFNSTWGTWSMVVMVLAAVAAALIYSYTEAMALSVPSKHYERMERVLSLALQRTVGPDLLEALGKEVLAEIGEWARISHELSLEMPPS